MPTAEHWKSGKIIIRAKLQIRILSLAKFGRKSRLQGKFVKDIFLKTQLDEKSILEHKGWTNLLEQNEQSVFLSCLVLLCLSFANLYPVVFLSCFVLVEF